MDVYIMQVRRVWLDQDGDMLADLLSLRHNHVSIPQIGSEAAMTKAMEHCSAPFDDLVLYHLKTISAMQKDDPFAMYNYQSLAVQSLTKILQMQKEENWMLPVMHVMCLELRLLAICAENSKTNKNTKPGEILEKCADCLMGCFRPLIRAIESSPYKTLFALAQQITYKFFVGRKAMFDTDYKAADEHLTFAFEHCHKQSTKNKRLILTYLVPVKMLLGYMPKQSLLEKYNLMEFWELMESVKKGDLRSLEKVMGKHEAFFIALQMHGIEDVDMDETECLVANLIYEGKIKGYISHQHKKLVISKQNPFPKLSTIP
ncbi:hypothetical protein KM043_018730 [Ampulex compressa]|nr:hypothetical protein KM043_018730 [Ampulex compressa]